MLCAVCCACHAAPLARSLVRSLSLRFYVDLPGDFWERGPLLDYLRSRQVSVSWDAGGRQYVMPFRGLTKVMEVKTELQMVHPRER